MRNTAIRFSLLTLLAVTISLASANNSDAQKTNAPAKGGYHLVNKVPVGGEGGWDYIYVDSTARRLYVSRGTRVMVFDADSLKPVGEIADTAGVHGVAIADDLGRGFTSNGRDASVTIFDSKTLKPVNKVKVGLNPDCIIYDQATHRVFAFNRAGSIECEYPVCSLIIDYAIGVQPNLNLVDRL